MTLYISGDCAGLSSLRCLPLTTEIVPLSVLVATCTDEFECTETCTVVHLVNHTSCRCSCDKNARKCKGDQVSTKHIIRINFSPPKAHTNSPLPFENCKLEHNLFKNVSKYIIELFFCDKRRFERLNMDLII